MAKAPERLPTCPGCLVRRPPDDRAQGPPCCRVAETGDGVTVHVIELPWIAPIEATRRSAIDRARKAIAAWLDVQPDTFDVERG